MENTAPTPVESWARAHARATGHRTREGLEDPGSCYECDERSPIWLMEKAKPLSLAELVARAQNSSHTDPTWRTDYR